MDKYTLFFQLPQPTILVALNQNYRVVDANDCFCEQMVPKDRAFKLSFLYDLLAADERSIFLSNIEIMNALKKTSTTLTPLKSLTLEGNEQCKSLFFHLFTIKFPI
jgi:hypothetical protein